jgi:hypothetical protein
MVALEAIRKIFVGVFTVIKTGITIVTFVLGLIKDVIVELTGLGTGVALSSLGKLGDVMAKLNPEKLLATLEKARGGIVAGAGKIRDAIQGLVDRIKEIFDKIPDFEIGFGGITKGFDKVSEKLKGFMDIFGKDDSSGDDPVTKRLSKVSKAFVDSDERTRHSRREDERYCPDVFGHVRQDRQEHSGHRRHHDEARGRRRFCQLHRGHRWGLVDCRQARKSVRR